MCDITVLMELIYDYVEDNPTLISEPTFEDDLIDSIFELYSADDSTEDSYKRSESQDCFDEEDIYLALDLLDIPRRSYTFEPTWLQPPNKTHISGILRALFEKNANQEQRTEEWYMTRYNMITASNAYKCFEGEGTRNQLIFEKCKPFSATGTCFSSNVESPTHWGVKYEPVSVMYYEHVYKCQVGALSCIQHAEYPFIGASPDGIVVSHDSEKYGRMLEIKNIFNREITGIPKKEYWVQMQMQMEVCNLEYCDFLETRFEEYATEEDYVNDIDELNINKQGEYTGVILYFYDEEGAKYVYKPFTAVYSNVWLNAEKERMQKEGCTFVKCCFWRLDEVSCVLVQRNRMWFSDNVGKMRELWDIVLHERKTGYKHREPKRKTPTYQTAKASNLSDSLHVSISVASRETKPSLSVTKLPCSIILDDDLTTASNIELDSGK